MRAALPAKPPIHDPHGATRLALERGVLEGSATLTPAMRRAASDHTLWNELPGELRPLLEKIWSSAYRVTDQDVAVLKRSYDDDALFEIIVACALGAARARFRAGLAALEKK